ncbi:MAG: hypothetical protein HYV15_00085 [Elusimicrobia bacterium]|nr:hypothetical protein [Elusimicrobiota bacterium]
MDDEPIEPEVVGREGPRVSFKSFGSPWALFGMLGAFSVGWFFLLALAYRWLWNYAFSADVTRLVYGAESLGYPKALASLALLLLAGWLLSPKRGS